MGFDGPGPTILSLASLALGFPAPGSPQVEELGV